MKHSVLILLITISMTASGQELKKQTLKHDDGTKEVFYVLESDPTMKHGEYRRTWRDFEERGNYEHNEMVGVWTYYAGTKVVQQVDLAAKQFIEPGKPFQEITWEFVGHDWSETSHESGPVLKGGKERAMDLVRLNLRYPAQARRAGIDGEARIQMIIQRDGSVTDHAIVHDPGGGIGEEALRVVKMLDKEWIPLMYNGNVAPAKVEVVLTFKLN